MGHDRQGDRPGGEKTLPINLIISSQYIERHTSLYFTPTGGLHATIATSRGRYISAHRYHTPPWCDCTYRTPRSRGAWQTGGQTWWWKNTSHQSNHKQPVYGKTYFIVLCALPLACTPQLQLPGVDLGMFYQFLCVPHSRSSTQSWGGVLPYIVETRDQNSRGCPLLFSNRNLGSFCA